ncbi:MAG: class I SAM-dependent methyltransferase [Gemmatimonadota bacterium]|nr:class I SAM-dependent methyltransferase [Gemmatimonadota bacterium]
MTTEDSIVRFDGRAHDYDRHRPRYPRALFDALANELAIGPSTVVVDLGSGTGLSAEPLLALGCTVHAVEPNAGMRRVAEDRLGDEPGFHSVAGRAERTTLPGACADLVVAAQAFHWFDRAATRGEMRRILRPGGRVALFWNSRRTDTAFNADYEALIERYATDDRYLRCRRGAGEPVESFFAEPPRYLEFDNAQELDLEGLRGRLESSSYAPRPGDPRHTGMLGELDALFARHERAGRVTFAYRTELYLGVV